MTSKQALDMAGYVERISSLFNRVMMNPLQMRIPEELADLELTASQFQGLIFVMQHSNCSVGDMAEGLSISHPAAVKMVERLQKKGLVDKNESVEDRRISNLSLTEFGQEVTESVHNERLDVLWKALERMSQDEIEGLIRGLEVLLESALDTKEGVEAACLRCGNSHIGCCVVNRSSLALTGSGIENP